MQDCFPLRVVASFCASTISDYLIQEKAQTQANTGHSRRIILTSVGGSGLLAGVSGGGYMDSAAHTLPLCSKPLKPRPKKGKCKVSYPA